MNGLPPFAVRANQKLEPHELAEAGADGVYRETLDTALKVGSDALHRLVMRLIQPTDLPNSSKNLINMSSSFWQNTAKTRKIFFSTATKHNAALEELIL
jgi:hypothetical protein